MLAPFRLAVHASKGKVKRRGGGGGFGEGQHTPPVNAVVFVFEF